MDRDFEAAKVASAKTAEKLEYKLAQHRSKLDNSLSANGYYRVNVAAADDCFFQSISAHLHGITTLEVRSCLSDCLNSNSTD